MLEATNEAKVSLILDITKALRSVETLQKRLDDISIKNIKAKEDNGLEVVGKSAEKATQKIKTTEQALRQAEKALKEFNYANRLDGKAQFSDEFKQLTDNVRNLKAQLKWEKDLFNSLDESKEQARLNKENLQTIKQAEQLASDLSRTRIENEKELNRIKKENQKYYNSEMSATNALLKYQQEVKDEYVAQKSTNNLKQEILATQELINYQEQVKNNYRHYNELANNVRQKTVITNPMAKELEATQALLDYQKETKDNYRKLNDLAKTLYVDTPKQGKVVTQQHIAQVVSYSAELARLERRATAINHELNHPTPFTNYGELRRELALIIKQYEQLNRESVNFRKAIGINNSRGFYDLNHNLDYLRSKIRGRLIYQLAGVVDNAILSAGSRIMDIMGNYQQNKVNFMQILPDELASNQAVINGALKEFTNIASDYGASVREVVEAGRLWGRQYKDISIVQELVRNSTKLSITDNMSLVEVNKGLEATMQQYNIHLKDANEAQQVAGKITDTWAKAADNAVVTAQDLAKANERSAGAAYQAGIGFDYLQAMIMTMSAATGKAGGEIGRSIRSMLVSMRSAKAEKEFAKLGIAITEMVNGEKKIRRFEDVINELMSKLKTSSRDVYSVINAMAGGKYQFNNIMALLKNQEQFQKNLEIVKDSQGWADEQVGRQYETISRQINALVADLQQLIRVLDEAGSSKVIVDMIKTLRQFVQALESVSPAMYKMTGYTIGFYTAFKGLKTIFPFIIAGSKSIIASSVNMKSALYSIKPAFSALEAGVISSASAFNVLRTAINPVLTLLTTLITLIPIIEGLHKSRDTYYALGDIQEAERQVKALSDFKDKYLELNRIKNDKTSGETTKEYSTQKLIEEQNKLREIIGEDAYERIRNSKEVVKAIDSETQAIILNNKERARQRASFLKDSLDKINSEKLSAENRIENNKKEVESIKELIEQKRNQAKEFGHNPDDLFIKNTYGITDLETQRDDLETSIIQDTNKISEYRVKLSELNQELSKINTTYKQTDLVGLAGGVVDNPDRTKDDYSEQTIRNQLDRERNQLWLQGKIEAQAYENALKSITNLEQAYGATEYGINQKISLFTSRKADLEDYQQKLENFRDVLISVVDQEMQGNQKVAKMVGYKTDMTLKDKLQNFEVNKELYQQEKTYSHLINLISTVNSKIEETKGKTQEVTNSLFQQEKAMYNAKVDEINRIYQLEDARINRPTNYNYEIQKNRLQIEQEKALITERDNYIRALEQSLLSDEVKNSELKTAFVKREIQTELILREQQYQKLSELENQKNYNIRNGLAEVTQSFLIEGNSLREIWKNLWQDLAREAIQRLFQIKATSSLLGMIFGLGSSSPKLPTAPDLPTGDNVISASSFFKTHTGASIGTYPKMHTGGVVANGKIGVVPKLQNNEVIRTLQVGEEVNSLQDRRSNEMLTAIVLKALDGQNNRPNNFNIFAMDSRSFAEYLNDNADILTAILAKQGAMGRR